MLEGGDADKVLETAAVFLRLVLFCFCGAELYLALCADHVPRRGFKTRNKSPCARAFFPCRYCVQVPPLPRAFYARALYPTTALASTSRQLAGLLVISPVHLHPTNIDSLFLSA